MSHVMIDIEGLGHTPDGVIASIGAVVVDPVQPPASPDPDGFMVLVSLRQDRRFEPDTVQWWLRQTKEAVDQNFGKGQPRLPLTQALSDLTKWCGAIGATDFWAWPAAYDLMMLGHAYYQTGVGAPWGHQRRVLHCARTICTFVKVGRERNENKHNPLSDARIQAVALRKALRIIGVFA